MPKNTRNTQLLNKSDGGSSQRSRLQRLRDRLNNMGEMDGASFVLFFYTPNEMFGTGKCEEYGSLGERFKNMPSMKLARQEFEAEIKSIQAERNMRSRAVTLLSQSLSLTEADSSPVSNSSDGVMTPALSPTVSNSSAGLMTPAFPSTVSNSSPGVMTPASNSSDGVMAPAFSPTVSNSSAGVMTPALSPTVSDSSAGLMAPAFSPTVSNSSAGVMTPAFLSSVPSTEEYVVEIDGFSEASEVIIDNEPYQIEQSIPISAEKNPPQASGSSSLATATSTVDSRDKWNKPSGTIKNKGVILKKACTGRKAKRNRNSTQTQQYFCPKCEINYDDDIGGGEWVQCSKSDTCTTWGHVNCMEASFICETCRSHN